MKKKEETPLSFLKELPILIISAVLIAWIVKSFIVQPFYIPSNSMIPTLKPQDRVIVNKLIYRVRDPQPGDIVVFIPPNDSKNDYIKRIIAIEGQSIEVSKGKVYIDGKLMEEKYVSSWKDRSNYGPVKVKEEHIFVMGDNRPNSFDSRVFGPVKKDKIIGKAMVIYWPPSRINLFQ